MNERYLAYLNHYDIRPCTAQYLWLYMVILNKLPHAYFVINKDYLNPNRNRIEFTQTHRFPYLDKIPESLTPEKYSIFDKVEEDIGELIPSRILKRVVEEGFNSEKKELEEILNKNNIKGALLWVNNKSVEDTFAKYNLPVIHNESGALRSPFFKDTIYFDFKGVNGNTSFLERFEEFKKISHNLPIFSRKELLQIVSNSCYSDSYNYLLRLYETKPQYECGVALQVDVDTNVLVYNHGITLTDVLNLAVKEADGKILVRNHPLSSLGFNSTISIGNAELDTSANSLEFISKCKEIRCLNSSVGFEALLLGRKVRFYGDTPFKWITYMNEEDQLLALNFAVISYLVPSSLVFDEKYYDFRVKTQGDEEEIYWQFDRYPWLRKD